MRDTQALMNEFSAAFQFFDGFGENWPALTECLCYMDEWLPAEAYVVVINHADHLLIDDEPNRLEALILTLADVGKWWSAPVVGNGRFDRSAVPFHALLHTSASSPFALARIAKAADNVGVKLRQLG